MVKILNIKTLVVFCLGVCSAAPAWTLIGPSTLGWSSGELTVGVNYTNCPVTEAELNMALDEAFELWNGVTSSTIKLSRGTSTETVTNFLSGTAVGLPVILCDTNFNANNGADPDSVPGLARLGTGSIISYGAIILNAESGGAANIGNISTASLALTVAHELGHLLGLGHSSDSNALMYFSISGKSELFLSQDDQDGITFLYPRNEFSSQPLGCASVHGSSTPLSPYLFTLFMAGLLCFNLILGRRYFTNANEQRY